MLVYLMARDVHLKQALRLRFCEELCPGKQQNDGEMTETQSTRTGRKTRCHPGKHPDMLYIVTRDRGGRNDVMRKSPIARRESFDAHQILLKLKFNCLPFLLSLICLPLTISFGRSAHKSA